jgi:hypothetical protein
MVRRRTSSLVPPTRLSTELRHAVAYPNRPPLPVIPVPIQILDEMPMPFVHMLFITLK